MLGLKPISPLKLGFASSITLSQFDFRTPFLLSSKSFSTGFSYSQVMPMVWRVLTTLDRLNKTHGLSIGVPEIAATYNLRTHGSFRYCLQSKSSNLYMVPKASSSDSGWNNFFFFVRRDSIPNGAKLPVNWVYKVVFEDLVRTREDSKVRFKALFKIPAVEREFRLDEETGKTSAFAERSAESMASGKAKSFSLIDLDSLIEDKPIVKQEHSKTLSPLVKAPTTSPKSVALKKRKTTTSAETEPAMEMTVTYEVEKLQSLVNFLGSKVESYYQMCQEFESSKKEAEASKYEAEAKLADLLKAISIKDLLLKKKDKEISDLKASYESEKKEFLEDAKNYPAASILESMIKMSDEVHAQGHVMTSWNCEAWKKKLRMLKGENADEDDTAGTSGTVKDGGADAETAKVGDKVEPEKKEGDGDGVGVRRFRPSV